MTKPALLALVLICLVEVFAAPPGYEPAPLPIVAVVGLSTKEGKSAAEALLLSGRFRVRGLTANPHDPKILWLRENGLEVIRGAPTDKDKLNEVFEGVYGLFASTDFYAKDQTGKKEYHEGVDIGHAAEQSGVQHVVRSTFEDTRSFLRPERGAAPAVLDSNSEEVPVADEQVAPKTDFKMFKYDDGDGRPYVAYVPHMDFKGQTDETYQGRKFDISLLESSFYFHDFLAFGPKRDEEGNLQLVLPLGDAVLPLAHIYDIGGAAAQLFVQRMDGKNHHGVAVGPVRLTGKEIAQSFSVVLGEPVTYTPVSMADFARFHNKENHAEEYGAMIGAFAKFDVFTSKRDTRKWEAHQPRFRYTCLYDSVQRFIYWIKLNKAAFV